jgi:hypothetical protein
VWNGAERRTVTDMLPKIKVVLLSLYGRNMVALPDGLEDFWS